MGNTRYKLEGIVTKLRQVEVFCGEGKLLIGLTGQSGPILMHKKIRFFCGELKWAEQENCSEQTSLVGLRENLIKIQIHLCHTAPSFGSSSLGSLLINNVASINEMLLLGHSNISTIEL